MPYLAVPPTPPGVNTAALSLDQTATIARPVRLVLDPRVGHLDRLTVAAARALAEEPLDRVQVLAPLNEARHLGPFLETLNGCLVEDGLLSVFAETRRHRKARFYARWPRPVAAALYAADFALRRVLPKLRLTGPAYAAVTQGRAGVLSKAELLGRLVASGFRIEDVDDRDGQVYVRARRAGEPLYPKAPSWGPLFKMQRVGRGGEPIGVYKLRTMHPYAEFLQAYMHEQSGLAEGGKLKDDFRVTTWGRFFRKVWIDELPMLINWLRGELKLVGVRPLSAHYLSLYPEDARARRNRHTPGLVPPFYADLPSSFEEIVESERAYLSAYEQHPVRTDLRYLGRALYNIAVRRARSQ